MLKLNDKIMENYVFMDLTALNPSQREGVLKTEGSVLVFAGAGSGKTRVLTYRIANIIKQGLARPYEIMAITFTNKAANEMKERLSQLVDGVSDMWISTIHSMCNRILRYDIDKIGYDSNFTIYAESEKERLIKRIVKEQGLDEKMAKTIKWHIGQAKCENLSPDQYENMNSFQKGIGDICAVYEAYEGELMKANALDFDDLLIKTYLLLSTNESVRAKYSDKFKYIHIDEFQDTNNIQYEIVKLLYKNHGNLFAVGDDDQSIYAFRGANVKNILKYEQDFPNSTIIKLEQNYRSTKRILEVANNIIKKNKVRADKSLFCENQEGARVEFKSKYNESQEAQYVSETIKSLVSYEKCKLSDIAVLYRMNSFSRSFESEFVNYNIPYKVFGGLKFFDRKEIKDLTAYLRCIVNPKDTDAFRRIINLPKRGIGDVTVQKIWDSAKENGEYFFEALFDIENRNVLTKTNLAKVVTFKNMILSLMEESKTLPAVDFLKRVITVTNFLVQFEANSEENQTRTENVGAFVGALNEFTQNNENANIAEFLQSIALMSSLDDIGEEEDNTVTLATVHAVKGLEFKVVFVVGLEETNFPIIRFDTMEDDIEEERRLMYVATTRAQERLYLTCSESRYNFTTNQRSNLMTSRFVTDVAELVGLKKDLSSDFEFAPKPTSFFGGVKEKTVTSFTPKTTIQEKTKDFSKFVEGSHVVHPKFGEGVVISVVGSGASTMAEVSFDGVGVRKLALKFAPLELK